MPKLTPLAASIQLVGLAPLALALGVTYQAIRKWEKAGRLPRTEWTGESNYSETIETLTAGQISRAQLMQMPWPLIALPAAAEAEA